MQRYLLYCSIIFGVNQFGQKSKISGSYGGEYKDGCLLGSDDGGSKHL
jgi:hypothetical protein